MSDSLIPFYSTEVFNCAPGDPLSYKVYFKPASAHLPACFQAIPKSLISWCRCVWSGLELNSAGQWVPRSRVKDLCYSTQGKKHHLIKLRQGSNIHVGMKNTNSCKQHWIRSITLPMSDEWHHLHTEPWVMFGSTGTNYTAFNTKQNGISKKRILRGKHFRDD